MEGYKVSIHNRIRGHWAERRTRDGVMENGSGEEG
jgi:hypothetical protein